MSTPEAEGAGPVLITGGHGFIGRRVVMLAQQRGLKVLAPRRAEIDWTDAAATQGFMAAHRPQAVLHLASPGVFAPDPDDPALVEQEVAMMHNLLASAPDGCRIIGGGSMAEYGRSGRLSEDSDCAPHNAYARAKFEAGQVLVSGLQEGRVTGCHARIFGAFGPGEAPRRLMPMVIASLGRGEPVPLSDGTQLRDFVHVDDVARAMLDLAAAKGAISHVINIGTGQSVRLRSAVERIARELGAPEALLDFGAVRRSPHDQDVLEADTSRLEAAIGRVPPQHFLAPAPVLPLL